MARTSASVRLKRSQHGGFIGLQAGRAMAKTWSEQVEPRRRQAAAWAFMAAAVQYYLQAKGESLGLTPDLSPTPVALTFRLDDAAAALARSLASSAAELPLEQACFQLSACYTALMPNDVRSAWGAYYTPPALTARLMSMAAEAGVDWSTARVLDPACGGGAFLLPAALKMRDALPDISADGIIEHFAIHLRGFEIDPFAAWLTQVWLEIAFARELRLAGRSFPTVVKVADSLHEPVEGNLFDLVIGNPPYGRITLSTDLREKYRRGLYGHANLYGLFTDLAIRWTRRGGIVAYVTPTSFFAGEYYKALRKLLATCAPPVAVDFITARRGVFDNVLQEALLATYRRGSQRKQARVHFLTLDSDTAEITQVGRFTLPTVPSDPWLAPRTATQKGLVTALSRMPTRLADWGYEVSTGPLVWNRFKPQFRTKVASGYRPVIWAEAVTSDGRFIFRAEKRGHQPYFKPKAGDDWLQVSQPCVLLQRTTAMEQSRRLIAAELPENFMRQSGPVIVENHLNMVRPIGRPKVSLGALAAFLNSPIADAAFRCINGSVAVSAFELEALPLPTSEQMRDIEAMIARHANPAEIHGALAKFYELLPA